MRLKTFCQDGFEFRVLADVFVKCNWTLLPVQPRPSAVTDPDPIPGVTAAMFHG
jgi:hypothetical protein